MPPPSPTLMVSPALGSLTSRYMLEGFSVVVEVLEVNSSNSNSNSNDVDGSSSSSSLSPATPSASSTLEVQLWSNIPHEDNAAKDWHAVGLRLVEVRELDQSSRVSSFNNTAGRLLKYEVDLRITSHGSFEYTIRYRRKPSISWRWASK